MKFYSEKLNQMFDTPEQLEQAEATTTTKRKGRKLTDEPAKEAQPTKKQLAAEVEAADEAVKAAYVDYESAKAKVEELSKQYLDQVNSIIEPAKKAIKDAEQKRYDAIRRFNETFGAYQVTYTGARAADELLKAITSLNSRANRFYTDFFNF